VIDLMIRKIVDDDISPHLRPSISIHRFNVRRIEKNRFPVKHSCAVCGWSFLCRNIEQYVGRQYYLGPDKRGNVRHVCYECGLENKVKLAAGTLYHLIDAVPRAERDSLEIYPGDWREALVPRRLKTGWDWRKLEEWVALGRNMIGVGEANTFGIGDYSISKKLLFKSGRYETLTCQKAASPVPYILATPEFAASYLLLLQQLKTPGEQWSLKRTGRFHKNSCWWPERKKPCLFDKCEASSWKSQSWNRDRARIKFDPADAVLLAGRENRETWRIARAGGSVEHPERSAKRHGRLAGTRAAYNEQWGSYTNNGRLGRTLRELRSLNIPRETIEARNAMIAKLEHDFAPRDEARAA
jgi:hypothetical protein